MHQDESALSSTKSMSITARQKFWLRAAYVVSVLVMVAVTHLLTVGTGRGFLLGTAETTAAGALAIALLVPMLAMRLIHHGKRLQGDRSVNTIMAGTVLLCVGATPLPMVALDLYHRATVTEAQLRGYGHATRVGRIAAEHPENARKIGALVGHEIMVETLGPSFPVEWELEQRKKIDAEWKKIGFDGMTRP